MRLSVILGILFAAVHAHPGEVHKPVTESQLAEASERHRLARACGSSFAVHQANRKAKRNSLRKRASQTASAHLPHYTDIQNHTCITAPEVEEGPYYINNELVREDLSEDQSGVKIVLDIGVIDTTTCEPLDDLFIELWGANATGVYSSYPSYSSSNEDSGETMVRNETFLRGGWYTDAHGIVELTTLYPGFYHGRTAHIHVSAHKDWSVADNGTLISHAGTVVHIGQFFFLEEWNDRVYAIEPYRGNPNKRTYNVDDHDLELANADGNSAMIDLELLGDHISEGLLGYITMGVNSSASYKITNDNYLNSTAPLVDVLLAEPVEITRSWIPIVALVGIAVFLLKSRAKRDIPKEEPPMKEKGYWE